MVMSMGARDSGVGGMLVRLGESHCISGNRWFINIIGAFQESLL